MLPASLLSSASAVSLTSRFRTLFNKAASCELRAARYLYHFHIFTSSHFHLFTFSHPHIFTFSHFHIFTSSHFHIFHFRLSYKLIYCCTACCQLLSIFIILCRIQ